MQVEMREAKRCVEEEGERDKYKENEDCWMGVVEVRTG